MTDRQTRNGSNHRAAIIGAVIATALYAAGVSAHPGTTPHWRSFWTAFADIGQCITPVVGALACWYIAKRSSGREQGSWLLIGAGAAAWGVGQVLWTCSEVGFGLQPVSPAFCDIGFLLSPVLIVAGLFGFVDTPAGLLSRLRGAIEGLLIAGGVLVAAWTILLAPVVATSAIRSPNNWSPWPTRRSTPL